ncbi:GMC family oxidoreductase [Tateyamaria pelophila]|uniref:GMC family oxidoreductase n=1 Tax=Tateyamaria pelophila TaxID=328415 RepID=UPI001CBCF774|nr:GMC family oxidoreductase [Tateyamaria pelophila]
MTMKMKMKRISTSLKDARAAAPDGIDLGAEFDAVVIGSGYGGAISAAKLTLAGQKVLLLERGREILPGEYPNTLAQAQAETQLTTAQSGRLTDFNGMADLHINHDMHVIVGCGLGGTSLLNANVSLTADPRVFTQFVENADGSKRYLWPASYRGDDPLASEYEEAKKALGANRMPDTIDLPKLKSLKKAADELNQPFSRPPINVTFEDGKNHFGNFQPECTLCGDCCSGCNYGSKNTTLMNYLPFAQANGATILTEAEVHTVAQDGDNWQVNISEFGQDPSEGLAIKAKLVVLGAGALGSTKILKRSEKAGLPLASDMLGKGFSGNGDILGFGFDANYTQDLKNQKIAPIYSVGAGTNPPTEDQYKPGPCIAGLISVDMEPHKPLRDGLVIEDGVAPGALSMMYPGVFFLDDVTQANFTRFTDAKRRLQDIADLGDAMLTMTDMASLSYTGAIANTQSYLVMSHDDATGELVYNEDLNIISVHWPDVGQSFPYPRDNEILRQASDAIWGNYLANPTWSAQFGWNLITVHPVGGCRMADTPAEGVVNADCHVYTGNGIAVYDGLMVCDGAVMPSSLGLNPLLTISAVTIRAMDTLIAAKGWSVTDAPKPAQSSQYLAATEAEPKVSAMPSGFMEMLKELEDLGSTPINSCLIA